MRKYDWDDEWILQGFCAGKSFSELNQEYNEAHNTDIPYGTFKWHCRDHLNLKRVFKMTSEQEQFIIDNFDTMSVERLRMAFNDKFDKNYGSSAFYFNTQRLGLRKHIEHQYTEEEELYLKENAQTMSRRELMQKFNEKFGTSIKEDAIVMRCWQKGYLAQHDGRFSKDRTMVIHIDGNLSNFDESNLREVDFLTFTRINNSGWLNGNEVLIDTAIAYCRLLNVYTRQKGQSNDRRSEKDDYRQVCRRNL